MKKKYLLFFFALITTLGTMSAAVEGALPGEFSVSTTQKVRFSKGNFQYQPSTHKCRFAENQYDMIGNNNTNLGVNNPSSYTGWIDLFGWGTGDNPGYNNYNYISYTVFTDWGINPITNGGNKANLWRTLSVSEWEYLLSVRTNASSKRSIAKINGKAGFILLPDAWILPDGLTFHANAGNFDINVYTITEWSKMEANGAVFFPAAGHRNGSTANITNVNSRGEYRTTSKSTYIVCTSSGDIKSNPNNGYLAHCGMSVRLVQNIVSHTITTSATNGIVTGGGSYNAGATATLTATANECYEFSQWSDGNTDNPRTITVTGNATYTALFEKIQYTIEAQSADSGQGSATITNP